MRALFVLLWTTGAAKPFYTASYDSGIEARLPWLW